jgi:acetyl esterase/lipase
MRFLATRLCEAGYAVATFDYRMIFRGGRLDESVDDVRAMFTWWGAQAERFRLDPARVSAMGLSAGATALLLATSPRAPLPLHHVISVFAIYDLGSLGGRLPRTLARLLTRTRDTAEWTRRSPIALPPCPHPLTLLHGTADGLTHHSQAIRYQAERDRLGLETRLHMYEGAPHGFFNDATAPVATEALGHVLAALAVSQPAHA